jgi:hypothetical protein
MSTIGKIESERMAALACVNRVLLRAAELDWQGTALGDLEAVKTRLERTAPRTRRNEAVLRGALNALRGATTRLNATADVMKTPTDFSDRLTGLVVRATAVAGQVSRIRNGST